MAALSLISEEVEGRSEGCPARGLILQPALRGMRATARRQPLPAPVE
jgi:hypothetical protein